MRDPLRTRLADATLLDLLLAFATGTALAGFLTGVGGRLFEFADPLHITYPISQVLASALTLVVCAALLLATARRGEEVAGADPE